MDCSTLEWLPSFTMAAVGSVRSKKKKQRGNFGNEGARVF